MYTFLVLLLVSTFLFLVRATALEPYVFYSLYNKNPYNDMDETNRAKGLFNYTFD